KKISDATVRRVERKLEERGYIPNMAATLLARNDSRIIGVVVKDHEKYEGRLLEDPFISASLNDLADEIEGRGYFMMLKKASAVMDIVRFASMWNLDGMVVMCFCADEYQNLRDHIRVPFVTYDGFMDGASRISNVMLDDFDGGRQAGLYLKEMGHRRVLFVADNHICMDWDRYCGLCEGLGFKADYLEVPVRGAERLAFYSEKLPVLRAHTATFAASDFYALELMSFLRYKGVRVPEEMSLVGFDGSRLCRMTIPTLTSVSQDCRLRASTAMDLLMNMISNPDCAKTLRLPVRLERGGSVLPCRG
ncbi:MAG: LacI family DNA-binding transcriptional regulator, partial [Clostridia bacterium]|nr:LacI family DNA-binding transcriptional regulator [Clostridia bacterium]